MDMPVIIYVMGASGVGKDAVLRGARARLRPEDRIAFAHRYITRAPDPRHENYVALTRAEFAAREGAGLFAFSWAAHGFHYAVGIEIETWREAGFIVVVSGSRARFKALRSYPGLIPVLMTAPPEVVARRLEARGRETEAERTARLARNTVLTVDDPGVTVIDNTGPVESAVQALLSLLRQCASTGRISGESHALP
jgi:ribose 1,5-bisphosphokinase